MSIADGTMKLSRTQHLESFWKSDAAAGARLEERIVNERTGGMKGRKPQRMELVPPTALLKVAEVYDFGSRKYDDHNWRKGYAWSLSYGAALRHLLAFWNGEDADTESGLPHVAHAAFHLLALLVFMDEHRALDDRPGTTVE